MKSSYYYETCRLAKMASAGCYVCLLGLNVNAAWQTNFPAVRLLCSIVAGMMVALLGGTIGRIR